MRKGNKHLYSPLIITIFIFHSFVTAKNSDSTHVKWSEYSFYINIKKTSNM